MSCPLTLGSWFVLMQVNKKLPVLLSVFSVLCGLLPSGILFSGLCISVINTEFH